jgi:hypothetical protein
MSNTEGESRALDLQNTYTEDIFYCWEYLLVLNIFENLISNSKQCWGSVCFWQCCGSGSCPYPLDELWIWILLSSSKNSTKKVLLLRKMILVDLQKVCVYVCMYILVEA